MQDTLENISLKHDNGEDMRFRGSLSSECSWYDEEHGVLCRQKLYVTENKDQISSCAPGRKNTAAGLIA